MGKFVVQDSYFKKAKDEGFRARSAYKLQEIQQKYRLVNAGNRVLDLGCAPGSWLQVLAGLVGHDGIVAGLDLLPVAPLPQKNVVTRAADIRELDVPAFLTELNIPRFDVITCDIAPNLSGIRDVDNARIAELYETVREVVKAALKPGGAFVFKAFYSEDFRPMVKDLEKFFARVTVYKPAASRGMSSEVYLVCRGKQE
jgi:23S rRNA (uridine2552-2'-O)-methyltransferase